MHKQKGMTLIGMLFTVVVLVMAGIVVMRVIPVYLANYSIVQCIKSLNTIPASELTGDSMTDIMVLKKYLNKRLDINGVEDLRDDQVLFTPEGDNKYQVELKYQVIKPLMYNISLMFHFDQTQEVNPGSEN